MVTSIRALIAERERKGEPLEPCSVLPFKRYSNQDDFYRIEDRGYYPHQTTFVQYERGGEWTEVYWEEKSHSLKPVKK